MTFGKMEENRSLATKALSLTLKIEVRTPFVVHPCSICLHIGCSHSSAETQTSPKPLYEYPAFQIRLFDSTTSQRSTLTKYLAPEIKAFYHENLLLVVWTVLEISTMSFSLAHPLPCRKQQHRTRTSQIQGY
jgi:hypothetical protein